MADADGSSDVGPEYNLTVCPHGGDEVAGPTTLAKNDCVEPRHHLETFVFERDWNTAVLGFLGTKDLPRSL